MVETSGRKIRLTKVDVCVDGHENRTSNKGTILMIWTTAVRMVCVRINTIIMV
jgi:hypothetical protein